MGPSNSALQLLSLSPSDKTPRSSFWVLFFPFHSKTRLMAWMRKLSNGLKMETAIFMLVFSLTLFSSESDGIGFGREGEGEGEGDGEGNAVEPMKWMLGSRPPRCLNKCLSCRPCKAVLVVSEHHHKNGAGKESAEREDSYYLLLWKCKCKDKFFHP